MPFNFSLTILDKKFSLSRSDLSIFFEIDIFWFSSFPPYKIAGTLSTDLNDLISPLVFVSLRDASIIFIKKKLLTQKSYKTRTI